MKEAFTINQMLVDVLEKKITHINIAIDMLKNDPYQLRLEDINNLFEALHLNIEARIMPGEPPTAH